MPKEWRIEVSVPVGASKAEEERLIEAAVDKKIEDNLDDMLGSIFK
ncbi:MAG: hypothetical protein WED09_05440 [Homoserinimonas sp.]